MRPDNQLRVPLRDVPAHVPLAILLERSGEQHDAIAGVFQNLPRRKIMLLRQNFGRSHERDLVAVLDGDDGGLKRHNRLARSHVALQQTPHRIRRLHIGGDFLQHPLLRRGRMKWQYLLNRMPHAIVQLKRDSGLRLLLPPLEFEPQLDKEQFIENQPDMRRRPRRLQIAETLARLRPVHFPTKLRAETPGSNAPRTAAGIGSGTSGLRFSSAHRIMRRNHRGVSLPWPVDS